MTRPKIHRCVKYSAKANYFKPLGVPMTELEEVVLLPEELEAIKLVYADGLEQVKAARKMKISQPTLSRIMTGACRKVAGAILFGRAIRIDRQ